jgi:hypothetical protein
LKVLADEMKIIVHCGLPKTGSTSIQKMLFENRNEFLSEGTVIPVYGRTTPGHRKLVVSRVATKNVKPRKLDARVGELKECRSKLASALSEAQSKSSPIILSSESFADRGSFNSTLELREIISKAGGDIRALAYIRPPLQHLPSSIQQEAKNYSRSSSLKSRIFAHIERVSVVRKLFGEENVDLRIFDRSTLTEGDVVSDFVGWVGSVGVKAPAVSTAAHANESIGASACAMLWKLQKSGGKTALKRARQFNLIRRLVVDYEALHPSAKLTVPVEWAEPINQTVASRWNELVSQCSNDAADRQKFLIEEKGVTGVEHLDKDTWVMSHFDPDYVARIAEFGEARGEDDLRKACAAIRKRLL